MDFWEPKKLLAVRVSDPDRPPVGIKCWDVAPTPTGPSEIVSDDFPVAFHARGVVPLLLSTQQWFFARIYVALATKGIFYEAPELRFALPPGLWYFLPKGQQDPHHGHAISKSHESQLQLTSTESEDRLPLLPIKTNRFLRFTESFHWVTAEIGKTFFRRIVVRPESRDAL